MPDTEDTTYISAGLGRVWPLLALTLAATIAIAFWAPQQLLLLLWGLVKATSFGYLGYWADRWLFPYARPDQADALLKRLSPFAPNAFGADSWSLSVSILSSACLLRRALVIVGFVVAAGWGQ